jgi:superoxide dismutase, Fe-Mn family
MDRNKVRKKRVAARPADGGEARNDIRDATRSANDAAMLTRRRLLADAALALAAGSLVTWPRRAAHGRIACGEAQHPATTGAAMAFHLPELPYDRGALAPHISAETLDYHHGKHHAAYVGKLNDLVAGSPWAEKSLEAIVREVGPGPIFNNAAQHWNHSFYWRCLAPPAGGAPTGRLADEIERSFGDLAAFKKAFGEAALTVFGSGWAWLVRRADGTLAIVQTANADNPLLGDDTALLTCDVWEHAYYVDYRNARAAYVDAFWNVVNWEFVAAQLEEASPT